jgi:hypothetical protein
VLVKVPRSSSMINDIGINSWFSVAVLGGACCVSTLVGATLARTG